MNYLKLFIAVLFLQGCDTKESVHFTEAQPEGVDNIAGFNKNYIGEYLSPDDSSYLTVSHNLLVRHKIETGVVSRSELDSSWNSLSSEAIQDNLLKDGIKSWWEKDSIHFSKEYRDTLFFLSEKSLARYFKGSYYLNEKISENNWEVGRLDLNKGELSLAYIFPDDSLFTVVEIDSLSPIKDDSGHVINYQIQPTKKQLKKLINADAFTKVYNWIKIKD